MKKIFTLALGLMVCSGLSYGQTTPTTPSDFPQQYNLQPLQVEQENGYNQKNFVLSINSISSGNWNQPGTWDCGCVPTFQDNVNILPGHTITVNQDIHVRSIFVDTSAVLNTTIAGVTRINMTGDWINNGEFVANSSEVLLNGYEDQFIQGETTFNKLSIEHNKNVDIQSPIKVTSMLKLEDATLNTNDQLTFAYHNETTATLYRVLTGTIIGDIIAETAVTLTAGAWFPTTAPVANATVAQWNDDVLTTGFTGSDFPTYPFININHFTESNGYVQTQDINESLQPGIGYFIYENPGTHTIDVQGDAIIGDFSFPVTYSDSVAIEAQGWNMLANPYVAPINWENQAGWAKTNIGEALYVWDANAQTYKVYMNGYTVNGGTPIINPFDIFYVKTTENPSLEINEYAKQNGTYVQGYAPSNYFKFKLNGEATADEIIIILDENASENYDMNNDAVREFSNTTNEISTVSADGQNLCINSLPLIETGFDIPLIINSPTGGTFTLDVLNMPIGINSCIALENLNTNEIYNLEETNSITFTIDPTEAEEVFMLHIGGSITGAKTDVSCNGLANGTITATGSGEGNWDYSWYDSEENLIYSDLGQYDSSTLDSLAAGEYTLIIGNLDFCPSLTQTVIIEEPEELSLSADIIQPTCNEVNSGSITSMVSGGNETYFYNWSTGSTEPIINELTEGIYSLTVTDINGCEISDSYAIEEATVVNAAFEIDQITPLAGGLNEVTFTNSSENAAIYLWEFGDGNTAEVENPTHVYSEPGEYVVTLTVSQGDCSMSYNYVLFVTESTVSIDELSVANSVAIANNNGQYSLIFNYETTQEVNISIHNVLGQEMSTVNRQMQNDKYFLELPTGKNQMYFITVTSTTDQTQKKIFKIIN